MKRKSQQKVSKTGSQNYTSNTSSPLWKSNFCDSMLLHFPADEESVLIKPRARSTASGKKIPAGAVSIFGGGLIFGLHVVIIG